MIKLSVNINKIATLRNSRGENNPNVLDIAKKCIDYGASGITMHPRPDGRHIKYKDVKEIIKHINSEINVEGYPSKEFISLMKDVQPTQCTLVPDDIHDITSNSGWDIKNNISFLTNTIDLLKSYNIRSSIFIDPIDEHVKYAKLINADRIELYTKQYADNFCKDKHDAIKNYIKVSYFANKIGIGINAGHDLNLDNLNFFCKNINNLLEVSIGHALICDSINYGLEKTIHLYLSRVLV